MPDAAPTDFELLDTWRQGSRDAGSALFERHFESLYRFFHAKVPEAGDDLIQATLLACIEARDRFRRQASFRAFLFGIARNQLLEHLRRAGRRGEDVPVEAQPLPQDATSPSALIGRRQEERLLLSALRALPLDLQLLLELYYWERLTAAHLAQVFDAPEGTIRTRLRRARTLVAEHIEGAASDAMARSTLDGLAKWADNLRAQWKPRREP